MDSWLKDNEICFRPVSELCELLKRIEDLFTAEVSLVCEYSIKIGMDIARLKAGNKLFQMSNQNCILKLYLKKRLDLE